MKRYLVILLLFISFSCQEKRTFIPDDEFGDILVQSVVADMFTKNTRNIPLSRDSISIFLPILDEYGYTYEDMDYTIERMVRRKSNVFDDLMNSVVADVKALRERYEYESGMGRKWRDKIKRMIIDTLYFSPDTMRIKTLEELRKLNYSLPINGEGDVIVKFNYRFMPQDSNSSRYVIFGLRDTITDRSYHGGNFWLGKSQKISKFSRELKITDRRSRNEFDLRLVSYTTNQDYHSDYGLKSIDVYIDSLMILFRPDPEVGDRRLRRLYSHNHPILFGLENAYEDKIEYVVPLMPEYGEGVEIVSDSVKYYKELPELRIKRDPPKPQKVEPKKVEPKKVEPKKVVPQNNDNRRRR